MSHFYLPNFSDGKSQGSEVKTRCVPIGDAGGQDLLWAGEVDLNV